MVNVQILRDLFDINRTYVVYGAGYRGNAIARNLLDFGIEVLAFVDKDTSKQNSSIYGITVYSPEYLYETGDNTYVIVSVNDGKTIVDELSKQHKVMPFITAEYVLRLSYLNCERYGYDNIEYLGSFMSPYPSYNVEKTYDQLLDINLNMDVQETYFNYFLNLYKEIDYEITTDKRYKEDNTKFGIADALVLYGMIRRNNPKHIIEIGSGYSSAVMLDTNEYCMNGNVGIEFIEPFADRLKSLLKKTDKIYLQEEYLQNVNMDCFSKLDVDDILFVDSSHVCKRGSDVNQIFFEIIPRLKSGVLIHIHDVFENFDYPLGWVKNGWAWNEDYLLRAFLMNNNSYEILFFTNMWNSRFRETGLIPNFKGGGSIWIRKK